MGGIGKYILQRVLLTIPMLFILLTAVFLMLRLMPGDPVLAMLGGRNVSPQLIEERRKEWGLDKPLHIQYLNYLAQVVRLDFGRSSRTGKPVTYELFTRLPA